MKLLYPAIFYKDIDTKTYTIVFPDLPGCVTQGENIEEAFELAEDAASGWLLTAIEDREEIPKPSRDYKSEEENTFVNYISIDISEYSKKYSNKSIKKTLTIPQWLNTMAEKEGLNFSQVLQTALMRRLELISDPDFSTESITSILDSTIVTRLENLIPKLEMLNPVTVTECNFSESKSSTCIASKNIIKLNSEKRNVYVN